MTIPTPAGPLVLADSIRDLSALRYLRFSQAWAKESGLGADMYATDSHLARLGLFLREGDYAAAGTEYNNLLLGLGSHGKADAPHLLCEVLAPLVVSLSGAAHADVSEAGLSATTAALLAAGLTQGQLVEAVEQAKKNFRPN
jgi:hypothetical protein